MLPHPHSRGAILALAAAALLAGPAAAADVNRYLPDDTEVVVFVNVRQLLDSPLVKKHALEQVRAALKDNAGGQKFFGAVGLDPLRDISSVTLAAPGSDVQNRALFIVSGNFNVERIHAAADEAARSD